MEDSIKMHNPHEEFILKGNLWKVTAQLSWPAVIAMVLYGLNSMLDVFFIGRYVSETAVAGVSIAYPISSMSVAFGSLVGVGAGSLLSIALGAKDKDTQMKLIPNANGLTLLCTIIYMVIAIPLAEPLIKMMGGEGETLALGVEYFVATVWGSLFWVMGLALNMIVRAEGRMKTAAWMMGTGLVVNMVCNYIFIAILGMGVVGAAWGTNIGMCVYSLIGLIYFAKGKASFKTHAFNFKMDKKLSVEIIKLGIPSLLMSVMSLVQAIVIFNALANFGTTADIAFYGVVNRIFSFLLTPIFGLMRALQPVLGINFGAKQYERTIKTYKTFSYAAMILTVPFWLVAIIIPETILGLMLTETALTVAQVIAFRTYMSLLPLLSFVMMGMTFFPAVKKPAPAGVLGMARQFVFYVPAMLIVPRLFGVNSVYYASFAIDFVITVWCMLWVKKEFKNIRKLKNSESSL
ncbi:MAG: MATE family efflux transporter [Spirochaetales bacterium]